MRCVVWMQYRRMPYAYIKNHTWNHQPKWWLFWIVWVNPFRNLVYLGSCCMSTSVVHAQHVFLELSVRCKAVLERTSAAPQAITRGECHPKWSELLQDWGSWKLAGKSAVNSGKNMQTVTSKTGSRLLKWSPEEVSRCFKSDERYPPWVFSPKRADPKGRPQWHG